MKTLMILCFLYPAVVAADTTGAVEAALRVTPAGATDLIPRAQPAAEALNVREYCINEGSFTLKEDFSPPLTFPSLYIGKEPNRSK